MISKDLEQKILHLYQTERWAVGTVATHLGIHHSTVRRVVARLGAPEGLFSSRPSKLDNWTPFLKEKLDEYPRITAARLFQMSVERGYSGSEGHFHRVVASIRPRKAPEAFLRLRTLSGSGGPFLWA